jgi:uncharacterized membrane protein
LFLAFSISAGPWISFSSAADAESAPSKEASSSKASFNLILPYTDVTIGQGQEFTMDAEVVNRIKDPVHVLLSTEESPQGWDIVFQSRYPTYPVRSVMVQGEKSTTLEFKAKVAEKTKPGNYNIKVLARDEKGGTRYSENITVRVTSRKVETGGLRLTSQYPVLSGATGQTYRFTVDLRNETNKPLTAALVGQTPPGWSVQFKPQYGDTQISSIALKENATESLSVEIFSPHQGKPGEYPVTVRARSGGFEASTELKITLRGTYDLKLGTATGTLNTSVVAGKRTPIDFLVGNAGSAPVRNLSFITKKPDKWTVEFKPEKIDALDPGEVREIKMEILAPQRTIAGDYLLTLNADSPEANKSVEFRVMVSTPTLWGWVGAGIVGAVILGLGIVFVRLGRR